MNKRIIASIVLLVVVFFGLFFFRTGEKNEAQNAKTNFATDELVEKRPLPPQDTEISEEEQQILEQFTPEELENLKYNHSAAQAANQNVTFYGLCVDQDGNPIEGVRIQASLTKMRKSMLSVVVNDSFKYYEELEANTDRNGRFEFIDEGSYLSLKSIEKEGYLEARGPDSFGFRFGQILVGDALAGAHKGDPLEPVVFTLWKKGDGSAATEIHDRNRARADFSMKDGVVNRVFHFDLERRIETNGASGESMKVTAYNSSNRHRDPSTKEIVGKGRYRAWSFSFEIPGGGFYETEDLFLFRPPEGGYDEVFTVEVPEGEENWLSQISDKKLYFKTSSGNYGAFVFDVVATANGGMGFRLTKLFFNPTGERNLENF